MSDTHIIAVACAKGGCAKTTTSMQLAGILDRWGRRTVVLDSDNTGGASKWAMLAADAGDPPAFPVVHVDRSGLDRKRILADHPGEWVFIDTPPTDLDTIQAAIDCADVTIIPTQPSVMDLRLAGETFRATGNAIVLLTRAKRNTTLTRDTIAYLDEEEITRFDTIIGDRQPVMRSVGSSELDMKEYSSVAQELIDYVDGMEEEGE